MRHIVMLALATTMLSGCAAMFVTTAATQTGIAAAENRSFGRKVDDTVIYTDLNNQFVQADRTDLVGRVTFNVRYARVMLTGKVDSEADAAKAVELSWKAKGVTEVINELVINPDHNLMNTANDALVKRNLEARLLITKGVWVINYSIDVQDGVAYLIGRVKDQAELDRALNVCRTTKGIKRVVSHLQINPDTAHPTPEPGSVNSSAPAGKGAPASRPATANAPISEGGGDIYTGPVYGSGSISSKPN